MTYGLLITRERLWTWTILAVLLSIGTACKGDGWVLGLGVGAFLALCALALEAIFARLRAPKP